MTPDEPRSTDNSTPTPTPAPTPAQTDIDLGERSIKSVQFPDTDRGPTDPFSGEPTTSPSTDTAQGPTTDSE